MKPLYKELVAALWRLPRYAVVWIISLLIAMMTDSIITSLLIAAVALALLTKVLTAVAAFGFVYVVVRVINNVAASIAVTGQRITAKLQKGPDA